ncbi:MAG: TetR/AcrR family transcriptional regulator [Solirubrobacteraceae bacterium]
MNTVTPHGAGRRPDGRSLRAERTHGAIVGALLALLDAGDVRPTAERIAERAGVSPRTVFQHFPDRDGLIAAAAAEQEQRVRAMVAPIDPALPLEERLGAFVEQRTRVLETITGVRRAAILLEPFSDVVEGKLRLVRAAARAEIGHVFGAELAAHRAAERDELLEALTAAASWPSWDALRRHQELGLDAARGVVRRTLAALLGA